MGTAGPLAEGSAAPASAAVAAVPTAGIGIGAGSGGVASLLLTLSSGLAGLGAVATRRNWLHGR
jgi:hypothetical protein